MMEADNRSAVVEFILLGFTNINTFNRLLFTILLFIYLFIITGNIIIVMAIRMDPHLSSPMYFFVSSLSFLEIWYTTVTFPKMLANLLGTYKQISFSGCLLQAYFLHALGATECYLLTVMSYDRYLAICKPLHYSSIMTSKFSLRLALGCWIIGFLSPVIETALISALPFCGPNQIPFLFCDFPPLISLACLDTSFYILVEFIVSVCTIMGSSLLVLLSYIQIIRNILGIRTAEGRRKTFSTCASHLTVVLVFFGSISFMYLKVRKSSSVNYDRVIALFYAVFTPLMNPIIYSLRNEGIKKSIKKAMRQRACLSELCTCVPKSK
ncbi:olfactory receptor 6N1-like [Ambystoma mexicanum]|uniref:olfactory receptor 6N1-like n=1 Tax=Ambystoma mexicanum TaxID=8296 RepID=UPI0037E8E9DD